VPNSPGICEIRTDRSVRLPFGSNNTIYIKAAVSLRDRVLRQKIRDPNFFLGKAEKAEIAAGHQMQFRYLVMSSIANAKRHEGTLIGEFKRNYGAPPIGNTFPPIPKTAWGATKNLRQLWNPTNLE